MAPGFLSLSFATNKVDNAEEVITIRLFGVTSAQEENIRKRLRLSSLSANVPESYIKILFNQSLQEISEALEPFGYYHANIKQKLIRLSPRQWQAEYFINLGPPVYIEQIDIHVLGEAESDVDFQELIEKFSLKKGDILLQQPYEQLKTELLDLALKKGYFDAKFIVHEISLDLISNSAQIHLSLASGQRYRFGKITFHQDILADEFVRRFIPFKEGDFYSADDVLKLQNNLNNIYFSSVEVLTHPVYSASAEVPITINLKPNKSKSYTAGLGYGTDTGARGNIGWEWRRVNREGHRLDFSAQPSQYMNNADIQYIIPGKNPILDEYTISAGFLDEDPPDRDLKSFTQYSNLSYRSGDPTLTWRRTIGINFQHDRYQNEDVYDDSNILLPSISWEKVTGNGNFAQPPGYTLRFNIRGAAQNFGSSTSFMQAQATGKYIYPIAEKNRLLLRTDLGVTGQETELTALPPSLRFYAGGDNSVRGYGYQSLGITEITSDGKTRILGGLYLVVLSAEVEHKLTEKLSVAAFFDAGQASNSFTSPLFQGVGGGVRWQTPIGPIRLDIAQPLNDPDRNIPRIHLSFGPDL